MREQAGRMFLTGRRHRLRANDQLELAIQGVDLLTAQGDFK
jgi:hypothetical protein